MGGAKPSLSRIKPVLEPLANLTEEKVEEIGLDSLARKAILYLHESSMLPHNSSSSWLELIRYGDMQILYKHHFDVHGLIEEGLAVNVNDLNKKL